MGGAEASQNGFGDVIPAKFTEMSGATFRSGMGLLQYFGDCDSAALTVSYCVDDFPAAIYTVAPGKIFWMRRLARDAIDRDPAVSRLKAPARF